MPEADALERLETARGVLVEWYKQYMKASLVTLTAMPSAAMCMQIL